MEDKFPFFFMKDEEIVEVGYATWSSNNDYLDVWSLNDDITIEIPGAVDRVVFETAVGCRQIDRAMKAGDTFHIAHDGTYSRGAALQECDRSRQFDLRQEQEASVK